MEPLFVSVKVDHGKVEFMNRSSMDKCCLISQKKYVHKYKPLH